MLTTYDVDRLAQRGDGDADNAAKWVGYIDNQANAGIRPTPADTATAHNHRVTMTVTFRGANSSKLPNSEVTHHQRQQRQRIDVLLNRQGPSSISYIVDKPPSSIPHATLPVVTRLDRKQFFSHISFSPLNDAGLSITAA